MQYDHTNIFIIQYRVEK